MATYVEGRKHAAAEVDEALAVWASFLKTAKDPALQKLNTVSEDKNFKFTGSPLADGWFVLMGTCHIDGKLIKWGKEHGLPRGFPIVFNPSTRAFRAGGFYPKFSNDPRQVDNSSEYTGVRRIEFFKKWSGFLCQVMAWETDDGELCWTTTSKNSGDAENDFVRNGAEVMQPYMTEELVRYMVDENVHFCLELLHQQDQCHGARVLRSEGIVTMVGNGRRSGDNDESGTFVDYWRLERVVEFCHRFGLPCDSLVTIEDEEDKADKGCKKSQRKRAENKGKSPSKCAQFLEKLSASRDFMDDELMEELIDEYGTRTQGTRKHADILGGTLEGLVMKIHQEQPQQDGVQGGVELQMRTEKYKFARYTIRTMLMRDELFKQLFPVKGPDGKPVKGADGKPLLRDLSEVDFNWLASTGALRIAEEFVQRWCVTEPGRQYWMKRFKIIAMLLMTKAAEYVKDPLVAAHILVCEEAESHHKTGATELIKNWEELHTEFKEANPLPGNLAVTPDLLQLLVRNDVLKEGADVHNLLELLGSKHFPQDITVVDKEGTLSKKQQSQLKTAETKQGVSVIRCTDDADVVNQVEEWKKGCPLQKKVMVFCHAMIPASGKTTLFKALSKLPFDGLGSEFKSGDVRQREGLKSSLFWLEVTKLLEKDLKNPNGATVVFADKLCTGPNMENVAKMCNPPMQTELQRAWSSVVSEPTFVVKPQGVDGAYPMVLVALALWRLLHRETHALGLIGSKPNAMAIVLQFALFRPTSDEKLKGMYTHVIEVPLLKVLPDLKFMDEVTKAALQSLVDYLPTCLEELRKPGNKKKVLPKEMDDHLKKLLRNPDVAEAFKKYQTTPQEMVDAVHAQIKGPLEKVSELFRHVQDAENKGLMPEDVGPEHPVYDRVQAALSNPFETTSKPVQYVSIQLEPSAIKDVVNALKGIDGWSKDMKPIKKGMHVTVGWFGDGSSEQHEELKVLRRWEHTPVEFEMDGVYRATDSPLLAAKVRIEEESLMNLGLEHRIEDERRALRRESGPICLHMTLALGKKTKAVQANSIQADGEYVPFKKTVIGYVTFHYKK